MSFVGDFWKTFNWYNSTEQPTQAAVESEQIILQESVLLSCQILAETFSQAIAIFDIIDFALDPDKARQDRMTFQQNAPLKYWLKVAGWCPLATKVIGERLMHSPSAMLFISNLKNGTSGDQVHTSCTSDYCAHNTLSEENYPIRHRKTGCECNFVYFDPAVAEQRDKIIKDGQIPLVFLEDTESDAPRLLVKSGTALGDDSGKLLQLRMMPSYN